MKVQLLVDLTRYNPVFTRGKVCVCDGVPVIHPNIPWQNCYVLNTDGQSLVVGEGSIKWIDKLDCSGLSGKELQNVARYTQGKMYLAEKLLTSDLVLMEMSKHEHVRDVSFMCHDPHSLAPLKKDVSDMDDFDKDWIRLYGEFIKEYLDDEVSIDYVCVKPNSPYGTTLDKVKNLTGESTRNTFITCRKNGQLQAQAVLNNRKDMEITGLMLDWWTKSST